jgi:hypothetical protein
MGNCIATNNAAIVISITNNANRLRSEAMNMAAMYDAGISIIGKKDFPVMEKTDITI